VLPPLAPEGLRIPYRFSKVCTHSTFKPILIKRLLTMFVNVGPSERKLRIIAGISLMVTGFAAPISDQLHIACFTMGVALLFPAALGFCPFKALALRKFS